MALKPVEMLTMVSQIHGWSDADLERKQALLLSELLNPHADPAVKGVFANDAEAFRVRCVAPYDYAVERYDPDAEGWDRVEGRSSCDAAMAEAKSWGSMPDKESMINKWDKARDRRVRDCPEFLRTPFPDKITLAEFWYDTKQLSWPEHFATSPWEFASNVAATQFANGGVPAMGFSDEFQEKLCQSLDAIESEWGQEKLTGAYISAVLGSQYDFFEGNLQRGGMPVIDGGLSQQMSDFERDVCHRAAETAAAVYGGEVWSFMDRSARQQFLGASFVAPSGAGREVLQAVSASTWQSLSLSQRSAIGRQLGGWVRDGKVPGYGMVELLRPATEGAAHPSIQDRQDVSVLVRPPERRQPPLAKQEVPSIAALVRRICPAPAQGMDMGM